MPLRRAGVPLKQASWAPALQRTAEEALRCVRGTSPTSHNPRRYLAAQALQAEQGVGAGFRDLDAFHRKMLAEELEMRGAFVELLRHQHRGEDRYLGAQLHVHQRLDHGVGHELMAIDTAI